MSRKELWCRGARRRRHRGQVLCSGGGVYRPRSFEIGVLGVSSDHISRECTTIAVHGGDATLLLVTTEFGHKVIPVL